MIDYRGKGACGADGNGRRRLVGHDRRQHARSSVLTSDERQPLANNFPTLGNRKQTHRDRQWSERTDGDEISSQSHGLIVREEVGSISPD